MAHDPQGPVPGQEHRSGATRWIGIAIVVVILIAAVALFTGGDRPDQMAPTGDQAPVVTTDPIAPSDTTPADTDTIEVPAQPADPIDPIDPVEQGEPQPIVE